MMTYIILPKLVARNQKFKSSIITMASMTGLFLILRKNI